ncbi:Beta-glucuronosyltransferase GlcAT14B [Gracilariopsis chorda]|uniref:Beta-glucuronosyltransferase GlcAT14B n=1 Tax=Gracilariopsis chorda TaxID=448386 RepID=A0A2V3IPA7_9FLOR|nr:Beta-glucuronosyltransferase GlcAT14B [Gracilariopsis chorda]|eukprot:PXF43887.1 Beta-glucuronosyltransferase GlcAT14B [Gracilariopsis chorda]
MKSSRRLSILNSRPSKVRGGLKRARRDVHNLLFEIRHPRNFVIVSFLVLLALSIAFRAKLRRYAYDSQRMNPELFDPSHNDPRSAFSEEACNRKYDAAWSLLHNKNGHPAEKDAVDIAYFIQVGNDSVILLERLFKRIHHPRNIYIVHIDGKVSSTLRDGVAALVNNSEIYKKNIHIMESEMITYRAITMVMNTIAAMTIALEKHSTWDYFINLSGADYPLVSVENQARLLARPRVPPGRLNFITFFPRKEWMSYSFRIRKLHWDPAIARKQDPHARLYLLRGHGENPMESNRSFIFSKAEAWMILSRPFVKFLIRSSFAKRMLVYHKHVLSVPEHYFADVLYNHPVWRKTIVPDALRKVVWYLHGHRSGQHPYVLDKGQTLDTFWSSIDTTRSLFTRKFSQPNSALMDRIDIELSGIRVNTSSPGFEKHAKQRHRFLESLVKHFDDITKKTLRDQGYSSPSSAYPKLSTSN